MIKLESYIKIYLPSQHKELIHAVANILTETFEGCTITEGHGLWLDDGKIAIHDEITILQSFGATSDIDMHWNMLTGIAEDVKTSYHEKAVAIEKNGQLYLV